MGKTMCKMNDEQIKEKQAKGIQYVCKKCGNESHKEKYLCKPKPI